MSKKFYAVNRATGGRWKPCKKKSGVRQFLMMYDTGRVAVVTQDFYTYIDPLDYSVWKVVNKMEETT